MAKKKLKSGDIYQIPLPKDLGFAYAKSVDLLELDPNASYPVLIRIYNIRSINPDTSLNEILDKNLVLSQLLIAGIIPVLRNSVWKVIGSVPLTEEEKLILQYKFSDPESFPKIDYDINSKWYYIIDADRSNKPFQTMKM